MLFALRVVVFLAAVTPLFAATRFHPAWWQTLLAAAIGSALGQLAVRLTRGRRVAAWLVAVAAALVAGAAAAWSLTRSARHDASPADINFMLVKPADGASLTWDDLRAIQTEIPSAIAAPYLRKVVPLTTAETSWNTLLVGTTPEYFQLHSLRIAAGAAFDDAAANDKVIVLGDAVVAQLFGAATNPVGETIRVRNIPFTVVGVLAHQGMSRVGQDLDDIAIVPAHAFATKIDAQTRFGGVIVVVPAVPGDSARVEAELHTLLRDRHRLAPGTDDDFVIRAPTAN